MTLQTKNEPFIIPIDRLDPIVEDDASSQRFYAWIQSVSERLPLEGSGSPEGALPADIGRLYIDRNGTQGNRIYMKASNSGERTGWELA